MHKRISNLQALFDVNTLHSNTPDMFSLLAFHLFDIVDCIWKACKKYQNMIFYLKDKEETECPHFKQKSLYGIEMLDQVREITSIYLCKKL
jgi:hypothetical protein